MHRRLGDGHGVLGSQSSLRILAIQNLDEEFNYVISPFSKRAKLSEGICA
jgi:hypothetical protein